MHLLSAHLQKLTTDNKSEKTMRLPIQAQPINRQDAAIKPNFQGIFPSDACCGRKRKCRGTCIVGPLGESHCAGVCTRKTPFD